MRPLLRLHALAALLVALGAATAAQAQETQAPPIWFDTEDDFSQLRGTDAGAPVEIDSGPGTDAGATSTETEDGKPQRIAPQAPITDEEADGATQRKRSGSPDGSDYEPLGIRLERQMASALKVAGWLADRPEVGRVLHPALPEDPGHALWRRDMTGASGLFSFTLAAWGEDEAKRLIDGLELFGIGASWGGYESLATLASHGIRRSVQPWPAGRQLIRLHIGLEDPDDLIADLQASFERVAAG